MAGLVTSYPVLPNNGFIVVGDSRTASSTDPATAYAMQRTTGSGYLGNLQRALGWKGECVGNFGINTEKIQGCITREHAQGIATGADPTWRAKYLDNISPSTAAAIIVLIGVNGGSVGQTDNMATCGPLYDTLFGDIITAGFIAIICNELPNTNSSGSGAANFARRQYLDNWPDSSSGLTGAQKNTYRSKRILVNTYDPMWAGAGVGSGYDFRTGYIIAGAGSNVLHPGIVGNLALGNAIAAVLSAVYGGFTSPTPPTSAGQAGYLQAYDMAGTGGTPGAGTSGSVATSWTSAISAAATSAGFTCALSKGTHPVTGRAEQLMTINGTGNVGGAIWNASIARTSGTGVGSLSDGDRFRMLCRLRLVAGSTGVMGIGGSHQITGVGITAVTNYQGYEGSSGFWADTLGAFPTDAIDDVFMTPPITAPTGWNSATSRSFTSTPLIWFDGTGTIPVSCTLGISDVGLVKL